MTNENEFIEDIQQVLIKYGLKRDSMQEIKIDIQDVHCPMVSVVYCMRNGVQKTEKYKVKND